MGDSAVSGVPDVPGVPGVPGVLAVLETASPVTVSHLSPFFTSKRQIKDMLAAIKASPLGHVPCIKNSGDNHKYLSHGWKPFRLRCNKCKHNLTHSQSLKWIAVLVDRGDVSRETVGLPPISPVPESPNSPPPTVASKHLPVRRQRPCPSDVVHVPSLTRVSVPVPCPSVPLSPCPSVSCSPSQTAAVVPSITPFNTLTHVPVHLVSHVPGVPFVSRVYKTSWIPGDGNCMFAAFARAINRNLSPRDTRDAAVKTVEDNQDKYQGFLVGQPMLFYLRNMSQPGTWGDNLMLQALCDTYSAHVYVLKRQGGTFSWHEAGDRDRASCAFYLSLESDHYENLVGHSQLASQ